MVKSGFKTRQKIVVLEWNGRLPAPRALPAAVTLRKMQPADLPAVAEVDALAFEPLWQNSLESLTSAYQQAAVCSVAEVNSHIIAYQISTSFAFGGHLARLAVHPNCRGLNIGYGLVYDLLAVFKRQGAWRVTVNTQNDNLVALALYQRTGFALTGEAFDVYTLPAQ
jgi:ribosomal-protein-alanine N-acetyltransferase